jgi:hypothetical protein
MTKRQRIVLHEAAPSTVILVKHGRRETEKLLLEGDGINVMQNEDGSVAIEVYSSRGQSIILRLSPEDTKAQAHIFKQWSRQ